jgi:hypothetical protein
LNDDLSLVERLEGTKRFERDWLTHEVCVKRNHLMQRSILFACYEKVNSSYSFWHGFPYKTLIVFLFG